VSIQDLPEELDARRVAADQHRLEVFDATHHGARLPLERRFAPAVEAGWSVSTFTNTQLRIWALTTSVLRSVIFITAYARRPFQYQRGTESKVFAVDSQPRLWQCQRPDAERPGGPSETLRRGVSR